MRQTDGRAITNPENAQSFSLAEIEQAADAMNPAELGDALDAWAGIAATVTSAGQEFETAIKKAVRQHWEGAAAESAVRAVQDYVARLGDFSEALAAQSGPLSTAANAAAKFKLSVSDVPDTSGNPADPWQRNSREEQARDEMHTQYVQPYGTTASAIPTLPGPLAPAAAPSAFIAGNGTEAATNVRPQAISNGAGRSDAAVSGNTSPAEVSDLSGGADTKANPAEQAGPMFEIDPEVVPAQAVPHNQDIETSTTAASTVRLAPSGSATPIAPTMPLPTTPATPAVPTMPQPTAPVAVTPSSANTPPNPLNTPPNPLNVPPNPLNVPPNSLNTPPSGPGIPGPLGRTSITADHDNQSRPGTSRAAPPNVAATPTPPSVPGRPAAPGVSTYSGMIPPGIHSRGTDDEHKSPKYLRTEEHAKELLGEVKPTVPSALGER
ncbi:PPE domain-containing protein [Nocardia sp. R6R-6]|uniref:PPE domain-containing protein n=1 Tax=Nocardia sp. R6R-6 TaxID=3459303 RepID=UPI00403E06EA